ncbi:MAG: DUF4012 domain-containing protein [bacterium]
MNNSKWLHLNKKPSQYQGLQGDIQPALSFSSEKKTRTYPVIPEKNLPGPAGKIPSPILFQIQKQKEKKQTRNKQSTFITLLLILSLFFSGTALLYQWGKHSYTYVSANALDGQDQLKKAQAALQKRDFNQAVTSFVQAEDSFRKAKTTLEPAKNLPINNPASSGYYLLDAGEHIASAGEKTCIGMGPVLDLVLSKEDDQGLTLTTGKFLKEIMVAFSTAETPLTQAVNDLEIADQNLKKVSLDSLDADQKKKVAELQDKLPALKEILYLGSELSQFLPQLLGNTSEQKYMIAFQNNWELRPAGGFMSGFSMMVVKDAQKKEMYTKNVYDIDGQLNDHIDPPKPLAVSWPGYSWRMRDANWDPDYPSSAAMIEWFYNRAVNESFDGIIAVDPTFMQYILSLTGPVTVSYNGQNITVNTDNLVAITEEQQRNTPQGTDPRKFLINLSSIVVEKILAIPKENWPTLLALITTSLQEKHIQINLRNPQAQALIERYNWAGKIEPTDDQTDFLMIIDGNTNGSKSCQLVKQEINVQTTIDTDGKVQNKVNIIYQHTGTNVWPSSQVDYYTRTYVPKGSKLIAATGNKLTLTEVAEAHGKTVFGDYLKMFPGETVNLTYTYELPFKLSANDLSSYKLYVQKQAGTNDRTLRFTLQLPPSIKPVSSPQKIDITSQNEVWFITKLNTDQSLDLLLRKQS